MSRDDRLVGRSILWGALWEELLCSAEGDAMRSSVCGGGRRQQQASTRVFFCLCFVYTSLPLLPVVRTNECFSFVVTSLELSRILCCCALARLTTVNDFFCLRCCCFCSCFARRFRAKRSEWIFRGKLRQAEVEEGECVRGFEPAIAC